MSLTLTPTAETVLAHTFARAMARAGAALGQMSGHVISVAAPEVQRCSPSDVIDMAGGPETVVVGVYVGICGALSGHALLMLPPWGAHRLAHLLLEGFVGPGGGPAPSDASLQFDELEISALQEVGNVTISTFLNELGMHLHEPVTPTVPQAVVEMAGAILDAVLTDLSMQSDQILAARTTFVAGVDEIEGALLVLPRPDSLGDLLDSLGASAR